MRQTAETSANKRKKSIKQHQVAIDGYIAKNDDLEENIAARDTINSLLNDEHETDIATLLKWTSDVEQYEEDILTLLKFKHEDSVRIKEHHLRLERAREKVTSCKKALDVSSTNSRMAQLGLDKTAESFR